MIQKKTMEKVIEQGFSILACWAGQFFVLGVSCALQDA